MLKVIQSKTKVNTIFKNIISQKGFSLYNLLQLLLYVSTRIIPYGCLAKVYSLSINKKIDK